MKPLLSLVKFAERPSGQPRTVSWHGRLVCVFSAGPRQLGKVSDCCFNHVFTKVTVCVPCLSVLFSHALLAELRFVIERKN